jgi:hypothetical protein
VRKPIIDLGLCTNAAGALERGGSVAGEVPEGGGLVGAGLAGQAEHALAEHVLLERIRSQQEGYEVGTTSTPTYEGWRNYQTWAVALWLDNEPGTYEVVRQCARDAYEDASETTYATRGQVAAFALAEQLREEHEAANPLADEPASVFADLMASALGLVDWHEIASHLVAELLSEAPLVTEVLLQGNSVAVPLEVQ